MTTSYVTIFETWGYLIIMVKTKTNNKTTFYIIFTKDLFEFQSFLQRLSLSCQLVLSRHRVGTSTGVKPKHMSPAFWAIRSTHISEACAHMDSVFVSPQHQMDPSSNFYNYRTALRGATQRSITANSSREKVRPWCSRIWGGVFTGDCLFWIFKCNLNFPTGSPVVQLPSERLVACRKRAN